MLRVRRERPVPEAEPEPLPRTVVELIGSLLGRDVLSDRSKTLHLALLLCAPLLCFIATFATCATVLFYLQLHPHRWLAAAAATAGTAFSAWIAHIVRRRRSTNDDPDDV